MADQRSIQMLGFIFASEIFVCKGFAQCLTRSVCTFDLHLRVLGHRCQSWPIWLTRGRYCDCNQAGYGYYPENSGCLRKIFARQSQTELKLKLEKCHFEVTQVEFLGRTISPKIVPPRAHKNQNFLNKLRISKSEMFRSATWVPWITTEIVTLEWLKNSTHSRSY